MEIIAAGIYVLIFVATVLLVTVLCTPQSASLEIQNYVFGQIEKCTKSFRRHDYSKSKSAHRSTTHHLPPIPSSALTELQWGEINFFDKEFGFPSMLVTLRNVCNETIIIERAKFSIGVVGRLRNCVEGHSALSIAPWGYNVQFDPLFEGRSTIVDIATAIAPHADLQLSFVIGQETSDVETPTLYHFHLQLEDSKNGRIISKPLTVAIPSPVKAKSYSMLEERANVIAENAAVIGTFSSLGGYCNPLANRILNVQSAKPSRNDEYFIH